MSELWTCCTSAGASAKQLQVHAIYCQHGNHIRFFHSIDCNSRMYPIHSLDINYWRQPHAKLCYPEANHSGRASWSGLKFQWIMVMERKTVGNPVEVLQRKTATPHRQRKLLYPRAQLEWIDGRSRESMWCSRYYVHRMLLQYVMDLRALQACPSVQVRAPDLVENINSTGNGTKVGVGC